VKNEIVDGINNNNHNNITGNEEQQQQNEIMNHVDTD